MVAKLCIVRHGINVPFLSFQTCWEEEAYNVLWSGLLEPFNCLFFLWISTIRIRSNRIATPVIIIPIPGINVSWYAWWCSLNGVTKKSWAGSGEEAGEDAGERYKIDDSEEFTATFEFLINTHN